MFIQNKVWKKKNKKLLLITVSKYNEFVKIFYSYIYQHFKKTAFVCLFNVKCMCSCG